MSSNRNECCYPALHVIHVRAQAMQGASDAIPSGMVSLTGLEYKQIEWLCYVAKKQTKDCCGGPHPIAVISSHLFSKGFVVAGVEEVIQFIEKNAVTEVSWYIRQNQVIVFVIIIRLLLLQDLVVGYKKITHYFNLIFLQFFFFISNLINTHFVSLSVQILCLLLTQILL